MSFLRRVVWTAIFAVIVAAGAVLTAVLWGSVTDIVLSLVGLAVVLALLVPEEEGSAR